MPYERLLVLPCNEYSVFILELHTCILSQSHSSGEITFETKHTHTEREREREREILDQLFVVDLLCFCSVLCLLCLCARLFICALWSPAGKGLTSWLSFVVSTVSLSLSHWYPGSGVVLDCIDS